MRDINEICDYIIFNLKIEGDTPLSNIKLQKLLYYVQAWHLAFKRKELFEGNFQAWVHGPVNREVFNRFKDSKYLYSEITLKDLNDPLITSKLSEDEKAHINAVLEVYAPYSGVQLEDMTHNEEPWISARQGYSPQERCEKEIDNKLLGDFFRRRIEDA